MIIRETHETEIKFSVFEKNDEFFIEPVTSNGICGEYDKKYDYWIDTCDTLDEALKLKASLEWKCPQ